MKNKTLDTIVCDVPADVSLHALMVEGEQPSLMMPRMHKPCGDAYSLGELHTCERPRYRTCPYYLAWKKYPDDYDNIKRIMDKVRDYKK